MKKWLMFTDLHISELSHRPTRHTQRNVYPHDQVSRGDSLYLVFSGTEVYGTGQVLDIEPDDATSGQGERWRVTFSQQFGAELVLRQTLDQTEALAKLFGRGGGNSNFIEITTKELIALNRILRTRGFHAPDSDDIDTRMYLSAERSDVVSVLFLDLDRFGQINKKYSHSVGDQLILEAREVVKCALPDGGIVERVYAGGDEMKVLLPNIGENAARAVAENIRKAIEDNPFSVVGRGELTVTIGLATYPENCKDLDDLFREADEAHGRAKTKEQRNSVTASTELLDD